jgi:hypothetical protein
MADSPFAKMFPSMQQQRSVLKRLEVTDPEAANIVSGMIGIVQIALMQFKKMSELLQEGLESNEDAADTLEKIEAELGVYALFSMITIIQDEKQFNDLLGKMDAEGRAELVDLVKDLKGMTPKFDEIFEGGGGFIPK